MTTTPMIDAGDSECPSPNAGIPGAEPSLVARIRDWVDFTNRELDAAAIDRLLGVDSECAQRVKADAKKLALYPVLLDAAGWGYERLNDLLEIVVHPDDCSACRYGEFCYLTEALANAKDARATLSTAITRAGGVIL